MPRHGRHNWRRRRFLASAAVGFLQCRDEASQAGFDGPAERDVGTGKDLDASGVLSYVGEGEMFPRRGQPARSEQVLRVDVPGGDARGRNAGRGERMPDGVDSAFVGDHGGDGEAGHTFVQHFGVHTIVEDVFGLVERFFPDRGHFGNGVAIFRADFGNAVMAKLILPVGEPDPYVRVASAMRQEGAQRLAYPVGEARCFPVHGFRDAEALNGLKDRCASGAALYKADPALADINTHNRALFAEQRTEGRGRRNLEGWGERSGSVVFLGCTADMLQQLLCGTGLACG